MKKENKNSNKQLIDKLLEHKFGEKYTKTMDSNSIDRCSMLNFLMQSEEMKRCSHIFVPTEYNFGNDEHVIFLCIKCGLNNRYPSTFASKEILKKEKEKLEIFEQTKENSIVLDCFDNPDELIVLYGQMKKVLPGLSDEDFIDYINSTFYHFYLNTPKKKRKIK